MPKIIDVINHRNKYCNQLCLVIDEWPKFEYERKGQMLIAKHDGFLKFLKYDPLGGICSH